MSRLAVDIGPYPRGCHYLSRGTRALVGSMRDHPGPLSPWQKHVLGDGHYGGFQGSTSGAIFDTIRESASVPKVPFGPYHSSQW